MRILSVDFGVARTGLAICDSSERLASPVGTLFQKDRERLLEQVTEKVEELGAGAIVVGHPRNMDGTRGESARLAEDFAQRLQTRTGLSVTLWDERLTTVSAIGFLNQTDTRGKKRKQVVDTVSAVIILQDYLDSRKNREN
ncbi:MAG: Holliday junction resolvase RuvX [Clostridiales bacterium]|nr:Holliday junction resolvase RuvX [Clostridiales bacterium]